MTSWADVLRAELEEQNAVAVLAAATHARISVRLAYHLQINAERTEADVTPIGTIEEERLRVVMGWVLNVLSRAPHGLASHTLRGLLHTTARPSEISAALPVLIDSGAIRAEGSGSHVVYRLGGREPGAD